MWYRLFVGVLLTGLLHTIADARGAPAFPFEDGLWHGDIETSQDGSGIEGCWASTTFDDGTTFTLMRRNDGSWHLQLTNPGWRLPPLRRYTMVAQVDFYPRLQIVAEARNQTLLEVTDLEQISLLGLIENGHAIELTSDGFNGKFGLEGSAKVIGRIRGCALDQ